jgi:hypothetical protein
MLEHRFSIITGEAFMNLASRQVAFGAVIAAALILGANIIPGAQPNLLTYDIANVGASASSSLVMASGSNRASTYRLTVDLRDSQAIFAKAFLICCGKVLGVALDAVFEVAAHLKQIEG